MVNSSSGIDSTGDSDGLVLTETNTMVTQHVPAGATKVPVSSIDGFAIGDTVLISTSEGTQTNVIIGFSSFIFKYPLKFPAAPGDVITKLQPTTTMSPLLGLSVPPPGPPAARVKTAGSGSMHTWHWILIFVLLACGLAAGGVGVVVIRRRASHGSRLLEGDVEDAESAGVMREELPPNAEVIDAIVDSSASKPQSENVAQAVAETNQTPDEEHPAAPLKDWISGLFVGPAPEPGDMRIESSDLFQDPLTQPVEVDVDTIEAPQPSTVCFGGFLPRPCASDVVVKSCCSPSQDSVVSVTPLVTAVPPTAFIDQSPDEEDALTGLNPMKVVL